MAAGADDAALVAFLLKWGGLILGGIATGLLTLIASMGNRIVKKHDEEIASIKGGIKKLEIDVSHINQKLPEDYTPIDRFEAHEERTRESIIALHGKIEGSEQRLAAKIDGGHTQIMNALLAQK